MNHLEAKKQSKRQNALAFVTIMPAFFAIMNVFVCALSPMDISSYITALVYVAMLIYIVFNGPIYINDILLLLVFYTVFVFNYISCSSTRDEMTTQGMLIIYFFSLPYCILCFKNISSWTVFWNKIRLYSLIVIFSNVVMMILLPYREYLDYMEFSYAILPAICASMYSAYNLRDHRILYISASVIGIVEMLTFGARAPAAYCLLFFVGLLIFAGFNSGSKKKIMTIALLLIGSVFMIEINHILELISRIPAFGDSYIIRRFVSGNLAKSYARELIWESCFARLETMGFQVGGFFGDRQYCSGVYPHNIALEILMSWGWVIGSVILIVILMLIIKSMKTTGVYREVAWFYIMTCFSRFLLSGTYVSEGKFWTSMFVLYAVIKCNKNRQKVLLKITRKKGERGASGNRMRCRRSK